MLVKGEDGDVYEDEDVYEEAEEEACCGRQPLPLGKRAEHRAQQHPPPHDAAAGGVCEHSIICIFLGIGGGLMLDTVVWRALTQEQRAAQPSEAQIKTLKDTV